MGAYVAHSKQVLGNKGFTHTKGLRVWDQGDSYQGNVKYCAKWPW